MNRYFFKVEKSVDQVGIPSATQVVVSWDTVRFASNMAFNLVSELITPTLLVPLQFNVSVLAFGLTSATERDLRVLKNGAIIVGRKRFSEATTQSQATLKCIDMPVLGDFYSVTFGGVSAGTISIALDPASTWFSVQQL